MCIYKLSNDRGMNAFPIVIGKKLTHLTLTKPKSENVDSTMSSKA
jgi:hypothetical protein